ncbi:DUF5827 family protein [Halobaculum sp. CBA1158]|uniref:DUF5827 family protein n=1 Tax=Halobaculum sp. CBA1158 TaxID=2904243 RepID=UPI001F4650D9|nr:DUF5827 family protein [Halobaculum sp. CBA1158]UIO98788.1 DUF5827 family protein [Halobaculum sp. CBA1158]
MPTDKSAFPRLHPCDFYTPEELFEPDRMYTVYEIARLLQGLEPDAEIDEGTEEVLLDWAIPWVMTHAADLVVAEPRSDDEPGYYGLREPGDLSADGDDAGGDTADSDAGDLDDDPAGDR